MRYKLPRTISDPQAVVTDAIWKGQSSCVLPGGTWEMGKPVYIPPGLDGFAITGECTLKSDGKYTGVLLRHSGEGVSHNAAAGDSLIPNFGSKVVADGAIGRDATDPNVTGATAGYNVLSDPDVYTTYSPNDDMMDPTTNQVQRELVYLTSDSAFGRQPTRYVSGGAGQGHAYGANSYYIPVNAYASRNLTITGLTLDGSNHPGGYASRLAQFWFVDGLVHNIKAKYFHDAAIATYFCRNKVVDVLECAYSSASTTGEGYCHADYAIFNAKTYSSNGGGATDTPAFYDIGSNDQGIRVGWYKAFGVADCDQYEYRHHNGYGHLTSPAVELDSHVGPGEYCRAHDISLTGTSGGLASGHQKFGYGGRNVEAYNITVNSKIFSLAGTHDGTFTNITGYKDRIFIGWGDRSGLVTGAFPTDPDRCTDLTFDGCSGGHSYTGTGFQANQEALGGTITFTNDILNTTTDSQASRLRSEVDCTISFIGVSYTCNGTVFRVCDIGYGAGTITLNVSNSAFALTDASNDRQAFRLGTTGTVSTVTGNTFTSAANASPTFMLDDSGSWTGEVSDPNP